MKVDEQWRHGGVPDASLSGHRCSASEFLLGQADVFGPFVLSCVRHCESAFIGFFNGTFCLFRAALLSALSGGVLAWDGLKRKGNGVFCEGH